MTASGSSDRPNLGLWGISASLEPIAGGHRNTVLKTVGLPSDIVFKTTRRSERAVAWLGPVHDAAETVGLGVPRYLRSARGHFVEAGWTAEAYVAGGPCPREELPRLKSLLSEVHRLTANHGQRPGFVSAVDLVL